MSHTEQLAFLRKSLPSIYHPLLNLLISKQQAASPNAIECFIHPLLMCRAYHQVFGVVSEHDPLLSALNKLSPLLILRNLDDQQQAIMCAQRSLRDMAENCTQQLDILAKQLMYTDTHEQPSWREILHECSARLDCKAALTYLGEEVLPSLLPTPHSDLALPDYAPQREFITCLAHLLITYRWSLLLTTMPPPEPRKKPASAMGFRPLGHSQSMPLIPSTAPVSPPSQPGRFQFFRALCSQVRASSPGATRRNFCPATVQPHTRPVASRESPFEALDPPSAARTTISPEILPRPRSAPQIMPLDHSPSDLHNSSRPPSGTSDARPKTTNPPHVATAQAIASCTR